MNITQAGLIDPWQEYGLQGNPFFVQALRIDQLEALFRGDSRLERSKRIVEEILHNNAPLVLLEGAPGLGKTTVMNHALANLDAIDSVYVYPRPIEISRDSTRETLAAEYLSAMTTAAILADGPDTWKKDPKWIEAHELVADNFTETIAGGGITFAGFGARLTRAHILRVAKHIPWDHWRAIMENIAQSLMKKRMGFVVHLNNLDAVSDEEPEKIRALLDETREILIQGGIFTALCANTDFRSSVIAERQRLLDVITHIGQLEQLQESEFAEVVKARYVAFKDPKRKFINPVESKAMTALYRLFDGDMRNTFKTASSAVLGASMTQADASPLSFSDIIDITGSKVRKEFSSLPSAEAEVIRHLIKVGTVETQKELIDAIDRPQPTISHACKRLENRRWIQSKMGSRKRKSLELTGYGRLLTMSGAAPDD